MSRVGCLVLVVVFALSGSALAARIVCTTTIVGDVVAQVAGEGHSLTVLLPIAADTGRRIVLLYTGSLSGPDGPAPTYLDKIRFDVRAIVKGLSETP